MSYKAKYKTIDLFAGCGGLLDGFEQSGLYTTISCVEWEKEPCKNLKHRLRTKWEYPNSDEIVKRFDIQRSNELFEGWSKDGEYGSDVGLDRVVLEHGGVDVIIGGPPCQAYSVAGRIRDVNGMKDDYRNYLFESYIRVVARYQPRVIVFENVQGMLSAKPAGIPVIDRIREGFDQVGYELVNNIPGKAVIDFTDYGVPQNRKRVILVGLKKTAFPGNRQILLEMFYDCILPQYRAVKKATVRDYILDLPKLFPSENDFRFGGKLYSHGPVMSGVTNHIPRYHNRRDISIFKELAYDVESGRNKFTSTEKLKSLYTEKTGKISNVHKYYVLRWDEQSNTIPAHLVKDGLRHIHPDSKQARSITVREAARLQTFDDDYEFISSQGDNYRMIGNAVPPLFAKKMALSLDKLLSGELPVPVNEDMRKLQTV